MSSANATASSAHKTQGRLRPASRESRLTVNERARLRELERETRELKMENEFLKKAAAYVCPER
jgi:transposase-like protein